MRRNTAASFSKQTKRSASISARPQLRGPPTAEATTGGYQVLDATGQALVYIYARETKADIAKVLTFDEAGRIAVNVAKLPGLLGAK